jgi:ABC-type sulfate/molybdate transport systems ATPase subunit
MPHMTVRENTAFGLELASAWSACSSRARLSAPARQRLRAQLRARR